MPKIRWIERVLLVVCLYGFTVGTTIALKNPGITVEEWISRLVTFSWVRF